MAVTERSKHLNVTADQARAHCRRFEQARQEAEGLRNKHIPSYLVGTPTLGDFLEEGLAQLGYSREEFERNHF
jgi:hypothetical protein